MFRQGVWDGSPWLDYKEATKTAFGMLFTFKLPDFRALILREVCISYPSQALGVSYSPMQASIKVASTLNEMTPNPVDVDTFSSPSQLFRTGALNEAPTGMRVRPLLFNYPCSLGDTILIKVEGNSIGMLVRCLIYGRAFGGERWL